MPMYCYRCGKRVISRAYPSDSKPKSITVDGRVYKRSWADEHVGVPASAGWPMECVASGVAPSQAQELRDFYRQHGVPTEVTADGNPVYRNARHRRRALKVRGMFDKSSFT